MSSPSIRDGMNTDFDTELAEKLKDPDFAREYKALELQSRLAEQVILARQRSGLTQAQLASLLGTKQSSISRLENMSELPSLSFLVRIADTLGLQVNITLSARE